MRLIIQEPGKPPRQVEAFAGLTIGRGPENACALDDDSASSQHARIVLVDGRLAVEDLGSRNGTRIEGGSKLGRGETFLLSPDLGFQIGSSMVRVAGVSASTEAGTLRSASPVAAEDLGQTLPHAAAAQENATLRKAPAEPATMRHAPAATPAELATMRHAPAATPGDAPTLRPLASAAAPPAAPAVAPATAPATDVAPPSSAAPAPAPAPASRAPDLPPVSSPASQGSIPIPAVIPKAADLRTPADLGLDGTMIVGGSSTDPAAIQAKLAALRPRLVFVTHKAGRSEPIQERETKIGRRKNGPVLVGLDDEGVSGNHALLTFDGRSFFVEDLDSRNGTWVGDTKLAPRPNRLEVRCDQKLRFGTVDALFVRAPETGESPSPADDYPEALASLAKDPSVPADKLREAQARLAERRHPGEFLIGANAITVAQWCDAIESARLRRKVTSSSATGGLTPMTWILVAALTAAASVIVFLLLR